MVIHKTGPCKNELSFTRVKINPQKLNSRKSGVDFQRVIGPSLRAGHNLEKLNSVEVNILFGGRNPRRSESQTEVSMPTEERLAGEAAAADACRATRLLRAAGQRPGLFQSGGMRTSGRGPARPPKRFSAAEPRRTAPSSATRRPMKQFAVDALCPRDSRLSVSAHPETPNQPPEPTSGLAPGRGSS